MADGESDVGPRGKRFGPGEGPQLLAHLRGTDTEVVGSDGEKVGNLKEVGDAAFLIDRGTLRRDVSMPVRHIAEVTTDERIVLDIPADQVDEVGQKGRPATSDDTDPGSTPYAESDREHGGT